MDSQLEENMLNTFKVTPESVAPCLAPHRQVMMGPRSHPCVSDEQGMHSEGLKEPMGSTPLSASHHCHKIPETPDFYSRKAPSHWLMVWEVSLHDQLAH